MTLKLTAVAAAAAAPFPPPSPLVQGAVPGDLVVDLAGVAALPCATRSVFAAPVVSFSVLSPTTGQDGKDASVCVVAAPWVAVVDFSA